MENNKTSYDELFAENLRLKQLIADKDLIHGEELYKQMYKYSPFAIIIHDKQMQIIDVNDYAIQLFGYTKEEFRNIRIFDLHPKYEHSHPEEVLEKMETEEIPSVEAIFVRKDKSEFFAQATPCRYELGSENLIHVLIQDITTRKQTETGLKNANEEYEAKNQELRQTNLELVEANKKAKESEMYFRLLVENAPDAIFIQTNWKFLYLNRQALNIFGIQSPKQLLGQNVIDRLHPDYHEKVKKRIIGLNEKKQKQNVSELVFVKLDGGFIDVETSGIPYEFNGNNGALVFVRDITERKLKENELKKALNSVEEHRLQLQIKNEEYEAINEELSQINEELVNAKVRAENGERKIKSTLDNMLEGCQILDFELRYTYLNKAAEIHNQRPNEELLGNSYTDMWPGIEKTHVFELIKSCSEEQKSYQIENEFVFPDGSVGWFDLSIQAVPEGVFILSVDITERKVAEKILKEKNDRIEEQNMEYAAINEELRQTNDELFIANEKAVSNEEYLHNIINNIADPVFVKDEESRLLVVNDAFCRMFNLRKDEIIGKTLAEDINPDEMENFLKIDKQVLKTGIENATEEQLTIRSGETLTITTKKTRYINSNGKKFLVAISHDITNRIKMENELKTAKEKAEESERLKTAFLQNMSHEIRTPMNAICGFARQLNKPTITDEKQNKFVTIIQNSSNQLLSIVNDILTISSIQTKQEKLNINKTSINHLLQDLLSIFKLESTNKNISLFINKQLTDKQAEAYTDETKITQILTNLISNALKFTHEGFIEIGYNLNNNELQFYVKDTGIGILPELQEKIFDRFRQADQSIQMKYGGTGLGLSISKGFVELLGGKIWVQSEPEKGSTFYFTIPYMPVSGIYESTTQINKNKNSGTILIAEDEEYNYLFIEELLTDFNYNLIHAKDGHEAIAIFKTNPGIDLILMDIKMPLMTGHEAAKVIKKINPNLPIVAQSAYALEIEIKKYSGIFDDYITKPINEENLIEKVNKYMLNK